MPAGVTVTLDGQTVTVKGPKGQLSWTVAEEIEVRQEGAEILLTKREDTTRAQAMWGLSRTPTTMLLTSVRERPHIACARVVSSRLESRISAPS